MTFVLAVTMQKTIIKLKLTNRVLTFACPALMPILFISLYDALTTVLYMCYRDNIYF